MDEVTADRLLAGAAGSISGRGPSGVDVARTADGLDILDTPVGTGRISSTLSVQRRVFSSGIPCQMLDRRNRFNEIICPADSSRTDGHCESFESCGIPEVGNCEGNNVGIGSACLVDGDAGGRSGGGVAATSGVRWTLPASSVQLTGSITATR